MIKVKVSANERLSGRSDFMRDAMAYFRRGEFDEVSEEDIPCDVIFEENGKIFAVELKTLKDFHASLDTDRFCRQLLSFIEEGEPCGILVFGSYIELVNSVPEFGASGLRSPKQMAMIKKMVESAICDCYGVYVPIMFLDKNPITSFIFLLNTAIKVLRGGCVSNMVPKPDKKSRKKAMLCIIKGVGEKTAEAIVREYKSLKCLSNDIENNVNRLSTIKVGSRRINPETVQNIVEAFS